MSIDALAREMSQATRDDVARSLDVEASLQELRVVRHRRRRVKVVSGLAAAAAVSAVVLGSLSTGLTGQEDDVRPAGTPGSLHTATPSARTPDRCSGPEMIMCLDADTVLVRDKVHYTFTVPPSLSRTVYAVPGVVELRGLQSGGEGVTVMTGVRPLDASVPRGAEAVARWVGSREFLVATPVRRGTLDGLETWNVGVHLATVGDTKSTCNQVQPGCHPFLEQPARSHLQTGIRDYMVSRYTFIDVPGAGTVAVWAWAFTGEGRPTAESDAAFERIARLIRSIDFRL